MKVKGQTVQVQCQAHYLPRFAVGNYNSAGHNPSQFLYISTHFLMDDILLEYIIEGQRAEDASHPRAMLFAYIQK